MISFSRVTAATPTEQGAQLELTILIEIMALLGTPWLRTQLTSYWKMPHTTNATLSTHLGPKDWARYHPLVLLSIQAMVKEV